MNTIVDEYLGLTMKEEIKKILHTLKTKKYSSLEINLVFPFDYIINE